MTAKLVFLIIDINNKKTPIKSLLFKSAIGDVTVMIDVPETEEDDPEFKIHICTKDNDITSELTFSDVFAKGSTLENTHFPEILEASKDWYVWNTVRNFSPGPDILYVLDEIIKMKPETDTDVTLLDNIVTVFRLGGQYRGAHLSNNGQMTKKKVYTIGPVSEEKKDLLLTSTKKPDDEPVDTSDETMAEEELMLASEETDWEATTEKEILGLINTIIPAIKYEGFSPARIRQTMLAKYEDNNVCARNLIMCFAAISHIGNNLGKLALRRVDIKIGKKLMEAISVMGIKKSDRSRNGLTLPRIAISFMPEYLVFRTILAGELQSQTSSSVSTRFKDVAFYGCPTIRSMTGYEDYHKEFSSFIHSKVIETSIDDAKFLKEYKKWNHVTIQGYNADTTIHARMAQAINLTTGTRGAALAFIMKSCTDYRTI